jgi:hypothetical protein
MGMGELRGDGTALVLTGSDDNEDEEEDMGLIGSGREGEDLGVATARPVRIPYMQHHHAGSRRPQEGLHRPTP